MTVGSGEGVKVGGSVGEVVAVAVGEAAGSLMGTGEAEVQADSETTMDRKARYREVRVILDGERYENPGIFYLLEN